MRDKKQEDKNYYYSKNREKRIQYQKEYDQKNKDKKREYDLKRRSLKDYNLYKRIQHYSQKHHRPILLKKYNGCQLCGSNLKLEIHHKRYTKKIEDCELLCQKHHKIIHTKHL